MMVDYYFYTGTYHGGSISADEWPAAEQEASAQLAKYKRIYTITAPENDPDAEKMAICAMAESIVFNARAEAGQALISSASIGSVSVSYSGMNSVDLSERAKANRIYNACVLYLDVYRGNTYK